MVVSPTLIQVPALPPPPLNQSLAHPSSAVSSLNNYTLFQHIVGDDQHLDNVQDGSDKSSPPSDDEVEINPSNSLDMRCLQLEQQQDVRQRGHLQMV